MTKSIMTKTILILCFIFSFLVFFDKVLATTGGPLILKDFHYDKEEKAVYFYRDNSWSEGGGVSIERYNPQTQKTETVFSYGRGWQMQAMSVEEKKALVKEYECPFDDYLFECVQTKMREKFEKREKELSLKPLLSRIDLRKNGIEIKVSIVNQERNAWDHIVMNLVASVSQHNKEKARIEFIGCYREEYPLYLGINFDGFLIPDSNTLLLLTSTRGICYEGGYLNEKLSSITDFEIMDSRPLPPRELEMYFKASGECEELRSVEWGEYEECMRRKLGPGYIRFYMSEAISSRGGTWISLPLKEMIKTELINESKKQTSENMGEMASPSLDRYVYIRGILTGGIMGIIGTLIIVFAVIVVLIYRKNRTKKSKSR